jgi:hypothetical protein
MSCRLPTVSGPLGATPDRINTTITMPDCLYRGDTEHGFGPIFAYGALRTAPPGRSD